jgi:chromosome segregation ATPase
MNTRPLVECPFCGRELQVSMDISGDNVYCKTQNCELSASKNIVQIVSMMKDMEYALANFRENYIDYESYQDLDNDLDDAREEIDSLQERMDSMARGYDELDDKYRGLEAECDNLKTTLQELQNENH